MTDLNRRALFGGAGVIAALAAAPSLASSSPITAFYRRLAEWKTTFGRYLAICDQADPDEDKVADYGNAASAAYHALLSEPAHDALGVTEKLHALAQWTEGCVIEENEVMAIAADAAAVLKGAH